MSINRGPPDGAAVFKWSPYRAAAGRTPHFMFSWAKPALNPKAGVILDGTGNLYGTTGSCGSAAGCMGVVFEITP
jgi:hypothetical protein